MISVDFGIFSKKFSPILVTIERIGKGLDRVVSDAISATQVQPKIQTKGAPFRALNGRSADSSQIPFRSGSAVKGIHSCGGIIMRANRFVVIGIVLSVVMSAVCLALPIKNEAEFGSFAKDSRPLQISELEYRKFYALFLMLTDYVPAGSLL